MCILNVIVLAETLYVCLCLPHFWRLKFYSWDTYMWLGLGKPVLCTQWMKSILLLNIMAMLMYFPYAWTERRYMVRSAISYCRLISGPVKCIQVSKMAGDCWLTFIIQSMCVTVCLLFRDIRSWAKHVYWLHKHTSHTFHPSPPRPLNVPLMMFPEFKKLLKNQLI